jgi:hypothetical protein
VVYVQCNECNCLAFAVLYPQKYILLNHLRRKTMSEKILFFLPNFTPANEGLLAALLSISNHPIVCYRSLSFSPSLHPFRCRTKTIDIGPITMAMSGSHLSIVVDSSCCSCFSSSSSLSSKDSCCNRDCNGCNKSVSMTKRMKMNKRWHGRHVFFPSDDL